MAGFEHILEIDSTGLQRLPDLLSSDEFTTSKKCIVARDSTSALGGLNPSELAGRPFSGILSDEPDLNVISVRVNAAALGVRILINVREFES